MNTSAATKIVVAEDDPTSRRILEVFLNKLGYQVTAVDNGRAAMEVLQREDTPQLVLLDWMMPEMNGLQICRQLRQAGRKRYPYIILLTARAEKVDVVAGLDSGADDYLPKPFDLPELQMRIRTGIRILELQEQLISAREEFRFRAAHDSLTGLYTHNEILFALERELVRGNRETNPVSVVMADLDHFKKINDTHGHLTGDEVLREASRRLSAVMRPYDLVGRYGGEEFLVVAPGCDRPEAIQLAERLRNTISGTSFETSQGTVTVTMSLGVATSNPSDSERMKELLRSADMALYLAKSRGRNRVESLVDAQSFSCTVGG